MHLLLFYLFSMQGTERKRIASILILALIVLGIVYINSAKRMDVDHSAEVMDDMQTTTAIDAPDTANAEAPITATEEFTPEQHAEIDTVTDGLVLGQQYTNKALGFGMTIPDSWNVDGQSRPGQYTVRFRGVHDGKEHFMNVWVHDAVIDVDNDPTGLLNGYTAFVDTNPKCPDEGGICDVAALRLPYDTSDMPESGSWETRVVDVMYGISIDQTLGASKNTDVKIFEEILKTFFFL